MVSTRLPTSIIIIIIIVNILSIKVHIKYTVYYIYIYIYIYWEEAVIMRHKEFNVMEAAIPWLNIGYYKMQLMRNAFLIYLQNVSSTFCL